MIIMRFFKGVSMAKIVRRSIGEGISVLIIESKLNKDKEKAWKELMKLSGFIKGGPKDISYNMDKYIKKMYKEKHR